MLELYSALACHSSCTNRGSIENLLLQEVGETNYSPESIGSIEGFLLNDSFPKYQVSFCDRHFLVVK